MGSLDRGITRHYATCPALAEEHVQLRMVGTQPSGLAPCHQSAILLQTTRALRCSAVMTLFGQGMLLTIQRSVHLDHEFAEGVGLKSASGVLGGPTRTARQCEKSRQGIQTSL